jgi:hypothetical protein
MAAEGFLDRFWQAARTGGRTADVPNRTPGARFHPRPPILRQQIRHLHNGCLGPAEEGLAGSPCLVG